MRKEVGSECGRQAEVGIVKECKGRSVEGETENSTSSIIRHATIVVLLKVMQIRCLHVLLLVVEASTVSCVHRPESICSRKVRRSAPHAPSVMLTV